MSSLLISTALRSEAVPTTEVLPPGCRSCSSCIRWLSKTKTCPTTCCSNSEAFRWLSCHPSCSLRLRRMNYESNVSTCLHFQTGKTKSQQIPCLCGTGGRARGTELAACLQHGAGHVCAEPACCTAVATATGTALRVWH